MGFFVFTVCLLILLLVVIIIGSTQQLTLWIVTKRSYNFVIMIIPAFLAFISFASTICLTYFILKIFDINTLKIIFSMFMNWEFNFHSFIYVIIGYFVCSLVFILLQALCLKLININYKKIYDLIKHKILKKEDIKELTSPEVETTDDEDNVLPAISFTPSFFHYISASLFTFSIFFAASLILMYIGAVIGKNYII